MFFSSVKEISRLISKRISNILLKFIIEKNWRSENFDFLSRKNCIQVSFWGALTQADIIEFSNFLVQLKNSEVSEQNYGWLFYYFYFERNYDVLKSKSRCILLNKI